MIYTINSEIPKGTYIANTFFCDADDVNREITIYGKVNNIYLDDFHQTSAFCSVFLAHDGTIIEHTEMGLWTGVNDDTCVVRDMTDEEIKMFEQKYAEYKNDSSTNFVSALSDLSLKYPGNEELIKEVRELYYKYTK